MSTEEKQYPATLSAVASAERSLWPVVDAIVAEIQVTPAGSAKAGEQAAVAAYLKKNGFPSWSEARVKTFFQVGQWLKIARQASDFQPFPFEWVAEAKHKAKGDHEGALLLLRGATNKRDIRPEKPAKLTPAQIEEAVAEAPVETKARIAKAAIRESKEVAEEVVSDPTARMRVTNAAEKQTRANAAGRKAEAKAKPGGGVMDTIALEKAIGRVEDDLLGLQSVWEDKFHLLTGQAKEGVLDDLNDLEVVFTRTVRSLKGEPGVDEAIDEMLKETR